MNAVSNIFKAKVAASEYLDEEGFSEAIDEAVRMLDLSFMDVEPTQRAFNLLRVIILKQNGLV